MATANPKQDRVMAVAKSIINKGPMKPAKVEAHFKDADCSFNSFSSWDRDKLRKIFPLNGDGLHDFDNKITANAVKKSMSWW
jgi:hypothetical protein